MISEIQQKAKEENEKLQLLEPEKKQRAARLLSIYDDWAKESPAPSSFINATRQALHNFLDESLRGMPSPHFSRLITQWTISLPTEILNEVKSLVLSFSSDGSRTVVLDLTKELNDYEEKSRNLSQKSDKKSDMSIAKKQNEAAKPNSYIQPSRIGKKRFTLYLDEQQFDDIRSLAFTAHMSVQDVIARAVTKLLEEHPEKVEQGRNQVRQPPVI